MRLAIPLVLALVAVSPSVIPDGPQSTAPPVTGNPNPALVIDSMAGMDLFGFYCASCHGLDARGHGPSVSALKLLPPDLTTIRRRNGGVFPGDRVRGFITNDVVGAGSAHGSRQMPLWGPIFMALDPSSEIRTHARIDNLVRYLESIQVD